MNERTGSSFFPFEPSSRPGFPAKDAGPRRRSILEEALERPCSGAVLEDRAKLGGETLSFSRRSPNLELLLAALADAARPVRVHRVEASLLVLGRVQQDRTLTYHPVHREDEP